MLPKGNVVSHRLNTMKQAEQIILLENGKIMEQGTHESMLEKRGTYFKLVNGV